MIYTFNIVLQGFGDNPQDAWADATEQFAIDPGPCDEASVVDVEKEEEE